MDDETPTSEQSNSDLILGFWFLDAWDLRQPPWLYDMWATVE